MKTINELRITIENRYARSAWDKGVKEYAIDLLDDLEDSDLENVEKLRETLLNGARNWSEYSWGGCALIYDCDIAERLCTPSELKRCNGGNWRPNRNTEWLDVQARALTRAAVMIINILRREMGVA